MVPCQLEGGGRGDVRHVTLEFDGGPRAVEPLLELLPPLVEDLDGRLCNDHNTRLVSYNDKIWVTASTTMIL